MKKLFRTSKSTVDPLPPPSQPTPIPDARSPPPPAPPGKKSFQSLMMGGGKDHNNGSDTHESKGWGFNLGGEKVTPFPVDLGRDQTTHGQGGGLLKKKEKPKVPTLQEMQQQQGDWRGVNGGQGHGHGHAHYDPPSSAGGQHPYLPPGARPPSPPPTMRPGTPTRYPYASTNASGTPAHGSQTSVHRDRDDRLPAPTTGRDRGYSSASDYEPPVPLPKMQPIRSPLANHPPPPGDQYSHTHTPPHHAQTLQQQYTQHPEQNWSSAHEDIHRGEEPREKEKKKFWGVAWGDKKDKHREKERERDGNRELKPVVDDRRPSFEGWRENESVGHGSTGHHSHHSQSQSQSQSHNNSNYAGQHIQMSQTGHQDGYTGIDSAENVTQAIDILVRDPDPPMSSIYAVCDRVNQSQTPDSICKEAAKALRRHFKHGNEGERRATAKIWFFMMRNIANDVFRYHAGSKKFVSPLEAILLAPVNKATVSTSTHRLLTEIVADLTYMYGGEKGCEGLPDLWKKVKLPQEPEVGVPLPPKHHLYTADNLPKPEFSSSPSSRRGSEPVLHSQSRARTPDVRYGPAYAALPNHSDDIRRLLEESIAAKESARVLTEALVFTRPEDLPSKPIIKFYRKCFMAHESLTNQMDWAQAEASRSRENINVQRLMTTDSEQDVRSQTMEEEALASLFEAHSALAEGIRQHDELERMAQDEYELKQVRERSRKDTRMDRNDLLFPQTVRGSGSRSPSPAPHARLPDPHLNRGTDATLPEPRYPHSQSRSRTPSPDRFAPPKMSTSPARAASPLSKAKGPRPLPDPLKRTHLSNPTLNAALSPPSHSQPLGHGQDEDGTQPIKPSRKALGKRRAVVDEDNDFDPDDMFNGPKKAPSASSDESTTDENYTTAPTPIKYAYDAYQEKLDRQKLQAESEKGSEAGHAPSRPRPGTEAHRA